MSYVLYQILHALCLIIQGNILVRILKLMLVLVAGEPIQSTDISPKVVASFEVAIFEIITSTWCMRILIADSALETLSCVHVFDVEAIIVAVYYHNQLCEM